MGNDETIIANIAETSGLNNYSPYFLSENYMVIKCLATGGFGSVNRGWDTEAKYFVALKEIKPELKQNERVMELFEREIELVFRLSHSCIVKALAHPKGCIVYEYINGPDLSNLIFRLNKSGSSFPLDVAAYIISAASCALAYAYFDFKIPGRDAEKIIHRDVSPQNILLTYDTGEAKLTDFGIAKALSEAEKSSSLGEIKGKPHYMSPEQARGDELDHRADIFALGVILFEMVTGKRPIEGTTHKALDKAKVWDLDLESLEKADISQEIKNIILKMLSRNREDRYSSGYEVAKHLDKFYDAASRINLRDILQKNFPDKIGRINKEMAFELEHIKELEEIAKKPEKVKEITPVIKPKKWNLSLIAGSIFAIGVLFYGAIKILPPKQESGSIQSLGDLLLKSVPSGSVIFLKEEGSPNFIQFSKKTPCTIGLNKGMAIKLKYEGFKDIDIITDFSRGKIDLISWQGEKTGEKNFNLLGRFGKDINFESQPEGAKVIVDEKEKGATPCKVELLAGKHRIVLLKENFERWEEEIDVTFKTENFNAILNHKVKFIAYSKFSKEEVSAKVTVKNHFTGEMSPLEKVLPYENLEVSAEKNGYEKWTGILKKDANIFKVYLEPIYPELEMTVTSGGKAVDGAIVCVDNYEKGRTDIKGKWSGALSPGKRKFEVIKRNYQGEESIVLGWGDKKKITIKLEEVIRGTLIVDPRPYFGGAEIFVDGHKMEYAMRLKMKDISGGVHKVKIKSQQGTKDADVEIKKSGETLLLKFEEDGSPYTEEVR